MLEASFPPGGTGRSGPPRRGASLPGERDIRHSSRHADGLAFCAPHETKFPRRSPVGAGLPFRVLRDEATRTEQHVPGDVVGLLAFLEHDRELPGTDLGRSAFTANRFLPCAPPAGKRNFSSRAGRSRSEISPLRQDLFPRAILPRKVFFLRRRAAAPEHCPFLSLRGDKKTPSRASLFRPIPRFFARSVPARRPFCRPFRRTRSFFIYKHPG